MALSQWPWLEPVPDRHALTGPPSQLISTPATSRPSSRAARRNSPPVGSDAPATRVRAEQAPAGLAPMWHSSFRAQLLPGTSHCAPAGALCCCIAAVAGWEQGGATAAAGWEQGATAAPCAWAEALPGHVSLSRPHVPFRPPSPEPCCAILPMDEAGAAGGWSGRRRAVISPSLSWGGVLAIGESVVGASASAVVAYFVRRIL